MDEFVAEVDEAIKDGKVPPTSKTPELIQTIVCALHVFNDTMEELLAGVPSSQPDTTISKTTLGLVLLKIRESHWFSHCILFADIKQSHLSVDIN